MIMTLATPAGRSLAMALCLTLSACASAASQADAEGPGDASVQSPDGARPGDGAPDLAKDPADAARTGDGATAGGDPPDLSQGSDDAGVASKVCPGATQIQGVDVSDYDGTIDWAQVKAAGKEFALIRVSDGTTYPDSQFAVNWRGAKAAGLAVGAYQYFRPDEDPVAQAELVLTALANVGFGAGDIPPITDVEVSDGVSNSTVLAHIDTWLQHIQASTGRLPIMYTSARVWGDLGDPTPSPLPYLWVANWDVSCPKLPPNWGRLRLWQYSDSGNVPGISDGADLDLYNGSLAELQGL